MMRSCSFLLHDKNEPKNVPQNQTILHLSLKCEHKRHEAASMPKHGLLDSLRSLSRIIHLSDSFRFDLRWKFLSAAAFKVTIEREAGGRVNSFLDKNVLEINSTS